MTLKKTSPSFIEGWEKIPGANNFEINSKREVRNFSTKKPVKAVDGIVNLYDNSKKVNPFNVEEIASKLFPETLAEVKEGEKLKNLPAEIQKELLNQIQTTQKSNTMKKAATKGKKNATATKTSKKAQSPTATKKMPVVKAKAQTPAKSTTKPETETVLVATSEEKKIAALNCMYSIKVWKLHKLGRTPKEIMTILNRPDKQTSTPAAIERYKENKKLQNRADLIKVA